MTLDDFLLRFRLPPVRWSDITLTTVGYGDVHPVTSGGKILATVAMFAGIGVIGAACGIMADALREASASEAPE